MIEIIIGILLSCVVPGLLIVLIFFRELSVMEKAVLSFIFSMIITITTGIYFGYDESRAIQTGGLTYENMYNSYIVIIFVLVIVFILFEFYKKFIKNRINQKKE